MIETPKFLAKLRFTRRLFLRFAVRGSLVPAVAIVADDAGAQSRVDYDSDFGAATRRAFAMYVDTLIPEDDAGPGALTVKADEKILEAARANPRFRDIIEAGCRWLDSEAAAEAAPGGIATFADLGEAARDAIVGRSAAAPPGTLPWAFFQEVRYATCYVFYSDPASWPALGFDGPPQPIGFPDFADPPKGTG